MRREECRAHVGAKRENHVAPRRYSGFTVADTRCRSARAPIGIGAREEIRAEPMPHIGYPAPQSAEHGDLARLARFLAMSMKSESGALASWRCRSVRLRMMMLQARAQCSIRGARRRAACRAP